jgi:cytochrome c553
MSCGARLLSASARRWAVSFAAVTLLLQGTAAWPGVAGEDAKIMAYGRHIAGECAACHRLDGADDGIPSIIGRSVGELATALRAYQTGERTNPVMVSVAKSLNDSQIEALAAYLGSLQRPK